MLHDNLEGVISKLLLYSVLSNVLNWTPYDILIQKLKYYENYMAYFKYNENTLTLVLKI